MREILFRGKRVDNSEWVEGFLTCMNYIDVWEQQICYDGQEEINYCTTKSYQVDENTVGQFTGLTDRNGKKIFEGDIVKEWSNNWKTPFKTEINIYEVVCEYLGSLQLIRKTEYGENSTLLCRRSVVEVIGNINDNPKLLEEL